MGNVPSSSQAHMAPGVEAPLHLLIPGRGSPDHATGWPSGHPFFAPEARSTVSATM
jgi:hypothetical protein